jgi:hypothetical protein
MIQRIQSLYLFLTSIAALLFLKGPYLTFIDNSGAAIKMSLSQIVKFTGSTEPSVINEVWLILGLAIIIPVLSLVVIFMFKRRDFQLLLSRILIALLSVFIGASLVYSYIVISKQGATFNSWYKLIIPASQLILSILAYRGIKKDDELVKSYDRLR